MPLASDVRFIVSDKQDFNLDSTKIRFIRISITQLRESVSDIIELIADVSWIDDLAPISKESLMARAQPTIDELTNELMGYLNFRDEKMIKDIGETVVSVAARAAIEQEVKYRALPLAELIKQKVRNNPGFDFHHEKDNLMIVFGESKYVSDKSAYNNALRQIVKFISEDKHKKDICDFENFLSDSAWNNINSCKIDRDRFCYSAAFSTSGSQLNVQKLINNIKNNKNFKNLISQNHKELILVAVDIK